MEQTSRGMQSGDYLLPLSFLELTIGVSPAASILQMQSVMRMIGVMSKIIYQKQLLLITSWSMDGWMDE